MLVRAPSRFTVEIPQPRMAANTDDCGDCCGCPWPWWMWYGSSDVAQGPALTGEGEHLRYMRTVFALGSIGRAALGTAAGKQLQRCGFQLFGMREARGSERNAFTRALTKILIDDEWLLQGFWFNLLTTLGCVHSMVFGAFHMNFYMARGLTALEVAAVHSFFSIWNPLNDIVAGFLVDEWVARGFGSRLNLSFWAHAGYAGCTFFAFQELSIPIWCQYAIAITGSDGFAAIASAVNGLILIEQTKEDRQRIQIQRLNSVFGCLEWLVMSVAFWLWDSRPGHCGIFRVYLSFVCLGSTLITLLAVSRLYQPQFKGKHNVKRSETMWQRFRHFMRVVWKHPNFWRYASVTAALEAEGVFFRQFDVVLIRLLLSTWMAAAKTLLVIVDPFCGLVAFALTWVAERPDMGVYKVSLAALRVRSIASIATCCVVLALNLVNATAFVAGNAWISLVLCILMMTCRAATRPAANLGNIVFASVIQEHALVTQEHTELANGEDEDREDQGNFAGKYWMLRAALVKPLNSLGPVIGSVVLAAGGYTAQAEEESSPVSSNLWWTCAWLPAAARSKALTEVCRILLRQRFFEFSGVSGDFNGGPPIVEKLHTSRVKTGANGTSITEGGAVSVARKSGGQGS
eukprot:Skav210937  [mRNA]  locus=scaffold713:125484:129481:+ [translate_table: standard]